MTGAFDHDLYIMLPGDPGEFPQDRKFGKLSLIVGVGNRTRAKTIT